MLAATLWGANTDAQKRTPTAIAPTPGEAPAPGKARYIGKAPSKASPNIIFILADDQGYGDLGTFFQNQRAQAHDASKPFELTPHLDRLAGEGTMLTQYYVAAPICAPSRASLMLGVSQGHANVRDNEFDKALDDNYTMPNTLRKLGYSTALIGKWGLEGNDKYDLNGYQWPAHPLKRGFDYYFGYMRHSDGHEHYPKEALYRKYWAENSKGVWQNFTNLTQQLDKCYTADLWTAAAKKYITDHVRGSDKAKPFFLYLAFETPHAVQELPTQAYPKGGGLHGGMQWLGTPGHFITTASGTPDSYTYPEYADATYDNDNNPATPAVPWPDTYKRYATANRRIDDAVGDVMQLLHDLKIDSNTLVIYTSDNGPSNESYLPEDKFPPNRPNFFSSFGPFDGIKADTWEGGVRLPVIARWPGHIPAKKVVTTPAIAYDWAPTFIDLTGHPAPERMDGISLLPSLTGKGIQKDPLVYIEYKNDEKTPDYKEFSAEHRGRVRGQTQLLRLGDFVGVRYDIQSANDNFEIYNVLTDPAERHNLATIDTSLSVRLPYTRTAVSAPLPGISAPDPVTIMTTAALQTYLKQRVLQLHQTGVGSPRPYDNALVPGVQPAGIAKGLSEAKPDGLVEGVDWKIYAGPFPWIPQTAAMASEASGQGAFPQLNETGKKMNRLSVFSGYIVAPKDGEYSFYMSCDARAFLRIHDIQVIDADYGYSGDLLRTGTLMLSAGYHPFTLSYYRDEDKGEPFLKLDWSGPGMARQRMQKKAFVHN
ncbi:MAG: sulfatase-like hydrolase/transferase [Chitinophaga rupis]